MIFAGWAYSSPTHRHTHMYSTKTAISDIQEACEMNRKLPFVSLCNKNWGMTAQPPKRCFRVVREPPGSVIANTVLPVANSCYLYNMCHIKVVGCSFCQRKFFLVQVWVDPGSISSYTYKSRAAVSNMPRNTSDNAMQKDNCEAPFCAMANCLLRKGFGQQIGSTTFAC